MLSQFQGLLIFDIRLRPVVGAALLALGAVLFLSSQDCHADAYSRTVHTLPGQQILIGRDTMFNERNCSVIGTPRIRVNKPPRHGRTNTTSGILKLDSSYAQTHCIGRPMRHVMIFYTPEVGFIGNDEVTFSALDNNYPYTSHVTIIVEPSEPTTGNKSNPAPEAPTRLRMN